MMMSNTQVYASAARVLGRSIYGVYNFDLESDGGVCRLHKRADEVVSAGVFEEFPSIGTHPVIRSLCKGMKECCALPGTLKLDYSFLVAAISMDVPGFAYLHDRGLSEVRKWEKGAVVGPAAFGAGYCYVVLVRPKLRMRVARVLGAFPLLSEFLIVLRLSGAYRVAVEFVFVAPGIVHCRMINRSVLVKDLVAEMLGFVEMDPGVRIGGENLSLELQSTRLTSDIPPVYGSCVVCGFDKVKLEGHEARCRVPVTVDSAGKLIGDAVHALDVKKAVVEYFPANAHYTVIAAEFLSAVNQREWLMRFRPGMAKYGSSAHSAADVFEANYCGDLRMEYCKWLRAELCAYAGRNCEVKEFDLDKLAFVKEVTGSRGRGNDAGVCVGLGLFIGLGLGFICYWITTFH